MICSCGGQMKPSSTLIEDLNKAQKLVPEITIDYSHMPVRESLHRCKPCGRVLYEVFGKTGVLFPTPAGGHLQTTILSSNARPVKRKRKEKTITDSAMVSA